VAIHIETERIAENSTTVTYRVTVPGSDFFQDVIIKRDGSGSWASDNGGLDSASFKMIGKLINQFQQRGYWPDRSGIQA
jgi:hypothetical protein